ncbi:MAG: Hsp33 family molecular chaperone HslO [Firmicutes bacterium]|nr:Hsp33 family molecular chaperone HslO [Candidatus Caballimonas caccae]
MNKLLKALVFDDQFSVSVLETTEMVNKAIKIHNLSPVASAALGRTMTVATFMSSNLKNEKDKLSITISGNGKGGKITVCGNKKLEMRGVVDNPTVDLPPRLDGKLDVGGFVGKEGKLTVIKSMGLKEPYVGSSALVSGEIAEDFTSYFAISEQQPTAIAVGVKIGKNLKCIGAGGVIIQALPFANEENIVKAENIMKGLKNVSTLIEENGAEGLLKKLFGEIEYVLYNPKYKCLCSRKYIESVLLSLGKNELYDIIDKEGKVEVGCEFCNKKYLFNREDIDKLF